ncbi:MAG: molybdate ABC transporter substrate-binding protein [Acidimicrobiia bacterium]|nr:molybdate ABC transporter substrate-binding protein [Acidimicrobiia bacterium]
MRALAIVAAVASLMAGCGQGDKSEVLVSAAASLTDAFREIETEFESAHPDLDIVLNFAGSSTLREQILAGAPVDVFVPASESIMQPVVDDGLVGDSPMVLARNRLAIAVPIGNPALVTGLDDFADSALLIGLCAPAVPCGEFARRALARAGVVAEPDTNEPDVRSLLTKIAAGELDAGIVYESDLVAGGDGITGIPISDEFNVAATYPIAVVTNGDSPDGAALFVAFVATAQSRSILAANGFTTP